MLLAIGRGLRRRLPSADITVLSADILPGFLMEPFDRRLPSGYQAFRRNKAWQKALHKVPHGVNLTHECSYLLLKSTPLRLATHLSGLPEGFIESIRKIREADVIVDIGGANINAIWTSSFYDKLIVSVFASQDTPIFYTGQGVEKLASRIHEYRLRQLVNRAKIFWVRERASKSAAVNAGVLDEQIQIASDDAFSLPLPASLPKLNEKPLIALQYRCYLEYASDWAIQKMAMQLDTLHETLGARFIGIGMHYGHRDERKDLKAVKDRMHHSEAISIDPKEHDPDSALALLASMDNSIGMSHHFAVLSILAGCPTVSLVHGSHYKHKSAGLSQQFTHAIAYLPLDHDSLLILEQLKRLKSSKTIEAASVERDAAISSAEAVLNQIVSSLLPNS